jgi:hypothetical protein
MNINDLAEPRKNEIRCARKISPVEAVAVSQGVNNASNSHFGLCVLAAYGGHIPAALFRGMNVHCYVNLFRIVRMKPSMSISCVPFT